MALRRADDFQCIEMEMKADVLEEAALLMGLKDEGGLDPYFR